VSERERKTMDEREGILKNLKTMEYLQKLRRK
jgi:hypothetical protein